jgi:hypothetical protein
MGNREIVSRECKFVVHIPADGIRPDMHYVKEILTYSDGTSKPNLRRIKDFKRPYYITKPPYQNHTDKKEAEELVKLNTYYSTQSNLGKEVAMRLGPKYITKNTLRDVSASPYVYGLDVSSKTIITKMYKDKYPEAITPYSIAVLDIETDTITDTICIISIAKKGKIFTAILADYIKNNRNLDEQLNYLFNKYIPKVPLTENIEKVYKVYNTEIELIKEVFKVAHEWQPDFLTGWNLNYDINKITEVCNKFNVDMKDIFSDPSLPEELRYYLYKEGQKSKLTESGKYKPVNPEEQWHSVVCPASFYIIDAMNAHRYVRVGGKSIPGGYSLDNVLNHELGKEYKKLHMDFIDNLGLTGIEWHRYMVNNRFLEYVIYNQWDVLSIIELDNKTKDLQVSVPVLSNLSSFDIFNSGPKRIVDALHFFYIDNGLVLGTKPPNADSDKLLGLENWIVLLPSARIKENGLRVIAEDPTLITNIRAHTYDSDQTSGYPSDTQAANVSKETTVCEVLSIAGHNIEDFKLQNINLIFGKCNSLEYAQQLLSFPSLYEYK